MGVSRDLASLLLVNFKDAVAHFSKFPGTVPIWKQESSGFSHLSRLGLLPAGLTRHG
jgi:glutamate decarboxylase